LLDEFAGAGACDFHLQFATPLPSTIFLRLMGMPPDDLPMFLQWRDDTVRPAVEPGDFEGAAAIRAAASKAISAYFQEVIDAARGKVGDGLISELVNAEFEGRPLNTDELLGIGHLMLLGGLDTVTATLDCMVAYLSRHPERRRQLTQNPALLPAAIEELLRHETPVMVVPRVVKEEITLGGVELQQGDPVLLVIGAANGDETVFEDPDAVNYSRESNRHVAFGGGNHKCLGAHLARLELRVALEEFHRRIPDYRIPDGVEINFSPGIRQPDHLPLVWD
jgi:cytochrome P450